MGAWSRIVGSSSRSLGRRDRVPLQVEDRLRLQLSERGAQSRFVDDDLREPAAVTEDEERHPAQPPLVVEPARYAHARPDVAGKLVRENALHRNHLLHTSPDRCGREAIPRYHRTSPPRGGLVGPDDGGRPAGSTQLGAFLPAARECRSRVAEDRLLSSRRLSPLQPVSLLVSVCAVPATIAAQLPAGQVTPPSGARPRPCLREPRPVPGTGRVSKDQALRPAAELDMQRMLPSPKARVAARHEPWLPESRARCQAPAVSGRAVPRPRG
jgi:hypothetical protein